MVLRSQEQDRMCGRVLAQTGRVLALTGRVLALTGKLVQHRKKSDSLLKSLQAPGQPPSSKRVFLMLLQKSSRNPTNKICPRNLGSQTRK